MSDAQRYAVRPDPKSRSRPRVLESHSRGVDRKSRTGLNYFLVIIITAAKEQKEDIGSHGARRKVKDRGTSPLAGG